MKFCVMIKLNSQDGDKVKAGTREMGYEGIKEK